MDGPRFPVSNDRTACLCQSRLRAMLCINDNKSKSRTGQRMAGDKECYLLPFRKVRPLCFPSRTGIPIDTLLAAAEHAEEAERNTAEYGF